MEGYKEKGYTSYHGEPLGSATKEQPATMGGGKGGMKVPYKGKITEYQGEPLKSATKDCK